MLAGLGFLILGERMKPSVAGQGLVFFALVFAESLALILTVIWGEREREEIRKREKWGRKYRVNELTTSIDKLINKSINY